MSSIDNRPNRQSVRLKDYDYSQPGAYFITICTDDKKCVFGDIREGMLVPSTWGIVAEKWWKDVPRRWPPVELDRYVLMPNHFHGILLFPGTGTPLPVLGDIVNWYKASVTKAIRRLGDGKGAVIWQRSYFEHVIRGDKDLERIRDYIATNPGKWEDDEYHFPVR